MKLSICISKSGVCAAVGTLKQIHKVEYYDFAKIITDKEENRILMDILPQIRKRFPSVCRKTNIVADSEHIAHKIMDMPVGPGCRTRQSICREMESLLPEGRSMVSDYLFLQDKMPGTKERKIICVAMEREQIGKYLNTFEICGFQVSRIESGVTALIKCVSAMDLSWGCFIVARIEVNEAVFLLYHRRRPVYVGNLPLACPDAEEQRQLVFHMIKRLFYYNRTLKQEADVEQVYLCGDVQWKQWASCIMEKTGLPVIGLTHGQAGAFNTFTHALALGGLLEGVKQ